MSFYLSNAPNGKSRQSSNISSFITSKARLSPVEARQQLHIESINVHDVFLRSDKQKFVSEDSGSDGEVVEQQNAKEYEKALLDLTVAFWNSLEEDQSSILFMKLAPPIDDSSYLDCQGFLPHDDPRCDRHTLVLDLDETLIHSTVKPTNIHDCDLVFPVVFSGTRYNVYLKKRPYLREFLKTVSELFEVVLFTASQECYAKALLDLIDPNQDVLHHRLYRKQCVGIGPNFVKDLRVLGRDLSKTIIIDNSPAAFTYQKDNGIPIISWYDDRNDNELQKMIPLLKKLRTMDDVRPLIRKQFQLKSIVANTVLPEDFIPSVESSDEP